LSRKTVEDQILTPMQASFLPPRADMSPADVAMALEGYVLVLAHFDAETLKGAWGSMLANHHGRAWPVPGRIVAAALHIERERNRDRRLAEPKRDLDAEREQYWRKVCTSKQARYAAEHGIAWSLKCAIINDGKSLFQVDLQQLVREHESAQRTAMRIEQNLPLYSKNDGRLLGVMKGLARDTALNMHHQLLVNEATTVAEILEAQTKVDSDGTQTPS
jgi:hypothetical protein